MPEARHSSRHAEKVEITSKINYNRKELSETTNSGDGETRRKANKSSTIAQVVNKYRMRAQPKGVEGLQTRGKDKLKPEK